MDYKMTKIEIITRGDKFNELKNELKTIGIEGITVSNVLGHGNQKDIIKKYRGVDYHVELIPKVKAEIVVCEVPVESVLQVAKRVLNTGEKGDGKIFVYEIEDALRVRTGERGYKAIL